MNEEENKVPEENQPEVTAESQPSEAMPEAAPQASQPENLPEADAEGVAAGEPAPTEPEEFVAVVEDEPAIAIVKGGTPPEENPLHVKIQAYDGPLDLLLELIKKNEMDIYDIQISAITSQYLDHLARMKQLDLEIAGEFLVLAATLIYIKSKMLLPTETEEEDEEGGGDPRAELVQRLLEYQAFKEAARELGFLESERGKTFTRQISDYYLAELDPEESSIDAFSANLYDLLSAFQQVLSRAGRETMHEVYEEMVSIEEKMTEIQALLIDSRKILFSRLFSARRTRNELIATFLAVLEIVRTKFARVVQEQQFGDILIEKI